MFTEAKNIFDIMAISYVHIREDKNFNYNIESNDDYIDNFLNQALSKYMEDKIYNPCNAFYNLKEELIILSRSKIFTSADYFKLILNIDSCEAYQYNSSLYLDDAFKTYDSLNIIFRDKIRIYPILLSNYREELNSIYRNEYNDNYLRDKKSYDMLSINSKLSNYIFYSITKHENYNIIIHELAEYEDFIDHIYEKGELKIALFPITSKNLQEILNIKYTKDKNFFVKNMNSLVEKNIIKKCKLFIEKLNNDIDLLIFPEMLMTEVIIDEIKSLIAEKDIPFVFYGSESFNKNNICRVFFENEEIFKYHKKIPFNLKYSQAEFQELIDNCSDQEQLDILNNLVKQHNFSEKISFQEKIDTNKDIHIIDINKLGRILTYICKDIDDDSYMNISRILQSDFIVLPACNPSNDLTNGAINLSERYHCTTIMCNTCSSLCKNSNSLIYNIESKKNIGFIITPAKDVTTRSHKKIFYKFNETCKSCNLSCDGRFFTINLRELNIDNDSISLNITEIRR